MNTDKLRELALAATEGPWEVYTQKQWDSGIDFFGAEPGAFVFPIDCEPEDAAYIAAANPAAILELLEALKEIGELPDKLRANKRPESDEDFADEEAREKCADQLQAILDKL